MFILPSGFRKTEHLKLAKWRYQQPRLGIRHIALGPRTRHIPGKFPIYTGNSIAEDSRLGEADLNK